MTVREQFDDFVRFCKKNKVSIGIVVLMTFLTYGFMLFNFSFSIDTEDIVVRQLDFYDGWIGINRYGLVFTKWDIWRAKHCAWICLNIDGFVYNRIWDYMDVLFLLDWRAEPG